MVIVKVIFKICILIFVAFGCTRSFNQEEAIRSLKVLNSDMANMLLTAGEMPEMAALRYLWNQPTAPLPFPNEKFIFDKPFSSYNFEESKGIYKWDTLSSGFIKQSESESVSFIFSGVGFNNAKFRITGFESQPISSRPDFPILMDAAMFIDNQQYMQVKHTATIEDELPLNINTNISGRDYKITGTFKRTRSGDTGTLTSQLTIDYEPNRVIDFRLNATIGYSSMGYYFEKINFDILLFRHTIAGKIDYDLIDPTAEDYVTSFNTHSKIEIYERPMKRKLGNIVLAVVNEGELLDYHIKFRNNEKELLSEYLPIINKILHVKL
jgi:hypothetical protein